MLSLILTLAAYLFCACASNPGEPLSEAERLWVLDTETAPSEIYRHDPDLKLYFVYPERKIRKKEQLPAIVFFFGGGWVSGDVSAFQSQARELADLGMVAVLADYRVKNRYGNDPDACVEDAKSAMRYVRANAARLHIDPDRICASGGSAGGHLAAATAFCPGFDSPGDDLSVSCVPQALVLFNPAISIAPAPEGMAYGRMSAWCPAISPLENVRPQAPPAIIFVGEEDTTCPAAHDFAFRDRMTAAGNRCEVYTYRYAVHGFFHYKNSVKLQQEHPDAPLYYRETLERTKHFLASLGWIRY